MATHTLLDKSGLSAMLAELKTKLPTTWAGSDSKDGAAKSAYKLTTENDKGSSSNPVFFQEGHPTACTFTVETSVPKDAKFTDTVYNAGEGLQLKTVNDINYFSLKGLQLGWGLTTRDSTLALAHDWIEISGSPTVTGSRQTVTPPEHGLHALVTWGEGMSEGGIVCIKGSLKLTAKTDQSYYKTLAKMTWDSSYFGRFAGSPDEYLIGQTGFGTTSTTSTFTGLVIGLPMKDSNFDTIDTSVSPMLCYVTAYFGASTNGSLIFNYSGTNTTMPSQYTLLVFI